jgi:hypothetical protein
MYWHLNTGKIYFFLFSNLICEGQVLFLLNYRITYLNAPFILFCFYIMMKDHNHKVCYCIISNWDPPYLTWC